MADKAHSFPCSQCGECCKRVHLLTATASLDRGDGICRHFNEHRKLCQIYQQRPDICRVDRQYEQHYQRFMTWEAFVELNKAGCDALITSK